MRASRSKSSASSTAEWSAQQVVNAFPYDTAPVYLLQDRDSIYGTASVRRVDGMGIEQKLIAPRSPYQSPYVERLASRSIRRECLDRVIIFMQFAMDIVNRAVEYPTRELAANAGAEGSVVVQEVKKRKGNEGYNVATGVYEDLVKAGVVEPKKVTRAALQNAASIAGLLLTTECLATEIPKEEKSGSAPGGRGSMGGMDY